MVGMYLPKNYVIVGVIGAAGIIGIIIILILVQLSLKATYY